MVGAGASASPPLERGRFPITAGRVYLDHAGVAPFMVDVAETYRERAHAYVDGSIFRDADIAEQIEATRGCVARLLGVRAADLAFTQNTTAGFALLANGLDWKPGDRVVVFDRDFPSVVYPWHAAAHQGVGVTMLSGDDTDEFPIGQLTHDLERGGVRAVAVSWVQYTRGWRADLEMLASICHDHDALLFVDVIQGAGVLPCNLQAWGVDAAAAGAHKWMLGPEGVGVLYVADELRARLRRTGIGWNSVKHRGDYANLALDPDTTARVLEGGTFNVLGILALGAAARVLEAAGIDAVWRHVDALLDGAAERLGALGAEVLSSRTPDARSAILTFDIPRYPVQAVLELLSDVGILCSVKDGGLRISPHGYNDASDLDALVASLEAILAGTDSARPAGPVRRRTAGQTVTGYHLHDARGRPHWADVVPASDRSRLLATRICAPIEARRLRRLVAESAVPRLHLGSGANTLGDWIDLDLVGTAADVRWDLHRPLPIPASSCTAVFTEHLLEHLEPDAATRLLCEIARVLEPGGIVRVGVPDVERYVRSYLDLGDDIIDTVRPDRPTRLAAFNEVVYGHGHRSMWDAETLIATLQELGFESVQARAHGSTLLGVVPDAPGRRDETLYVEGRRTSVRPHP